LVAELAWLRGQRAAPSLPAAPCHQGPAFYPLKPFAGCLEMDSGVYRWLAEDPIWFWDVFQLPDDPETLGFEMEHDDSDPETLGFEMKHDDSWLGYVVRHGLRRLLRDGTPVCGLALTVLSDVLLDWL